MASKKLMDLAAPAMEESTLDISSMIDLVFLLLIFFMTASHIIIVPLDEEVQVPVAEHSHPPDITLGRIVLNIRGDGTIVDVNDKVLARGDQDMTDVGPYILDLADQYRDKERLDPKLHIRADVNVEVKRIKELVKAAADARVVDVIFATTKE